MNTSQTLPGVVTALGQPGFDRTILDFVHVHAGVNLLSAFSLSGPERPRLRLAIGLPTLHSDFAKAVSLQDAGELSRDHLGLRWMSGAKPSAGNVVLRQPCNVTPHRNIAIEQANMLERVAVYGRPGGDPMLLNLYRLQSTGPFGTADLDWIDDQAALLTALISRHTAQIGTEVTPALHPHRDVVAGRLRAAVAQLSVREAEICAGLLVGDPVKQIARAANLEPSTVVTYKKRAYVKLGISTRIDLVRAYAAIGT